MNGANVRVCLRVCVHVFTQHGHMKLAALLSFRFSLLAENQSRPRVLQVRFEADINARASLAAVLWCSPVLASVRLEPNRACIHLGTGINSPRTGPVVR